MAQLRQAIDQHTAELATLSGKGSGARRKALLRRCEEMQQQIAGFEERLAQYRKDNAANPCPFRIVIRADSAFGTAEVVQRLLELGYDLVIKRYTITTFRNLWDQAPASVWMEVGKKRQASEQLPLPPLPIPAPFAVRQIALRRWDVDKREVRSVILTTFGVEEMPLNRVVACYEARQSIEAGFQEWKGTFHFGNPRLRKFEANAAFLQLVLFAFNLIRWAWFLMRSNSERFRRAGSKTLLHVAACCRATVWFTDQFLRLLFSRNTGLSGVEICVLHPPDHVLGTDDALFAPILS